MTLSIVILRPRSRDLSALEFILLRSQSWSRELCGRVSFTAGCSRQDQIKA